MLNECQGASKKFHFMNFGITKSSIPNIVLLLVFTALLTILKFFHEPWRDELNDYGFMWRRPSALSVFQESFSSGFLPLYPYHTSIFVLIGSYEYKKWFVWLVLVVATLLFVQIREIPLIHKAALLMSPYVFLNGVPSIGTTH